jgi:hypothetical protein
MYALTFNGTFQLEYPNEFLADLEELKKKHDCEFFGNLGLQNLGNYVDFQKIEDSDVKTIEPNEKV